MIKVFTFFILFFTLLFNTSVFSQEWIHTINGQSDSDDRGYGIVVDAAGNVYTAGYLTNNNTGIDILVTKHSNSGNLLWQYSFNGTGNSTDKAYGIVVDNSSNVYITGYTTRTGGNIDYVTLKLNSSGTLKWSKTYNGGASQEDKAWGIVVDASENCFVTGTSKSSSSGKDCVTLKYNKDGVQIWAKTFDAEMHKDDEATCIAMDSNGDIYVGGYGVFSSGNTDYLLIKYNISGTLKWSKNYNGPAEENDRAWGIVVDASDNVYITGESAGTNSKNDIATLKYNSSGTLLWTSRFNGTEGHDDKAYGIVVDESSGSCIITGTSETNDRGIDIVTLKLNTSSGSTAWQKTFDGTGHSNDIAYDIVISKSAVNRKVFITGTTRYGTSVQSENIVVLVYNMSGNLLRMNTYGGEAGLDDGAFGIAVDQNDNYYLAGYMGVQSGANDLASSYDMVAVKYSGSGLNSIIKASGNIPEKFGLHQNYPNPFNPETKIKFDVAENTNVNIRIYDITGKQVSPALNSELKAGSYEFNFNASALSSGIYFYTLTAGSFTETKKMTLIK
ncbi:MAG: T9SS type A sorting domain-containing protein [Ignavibacteria bacterium]|nr:T9SS type A sorting domain-containing protein [Ignavibacteria bacterium]